MGEIQRISPHSVLDLGVGFGKWGVLCREILDARFGRCKPDQWETQIEGIESFEGYRNPAWDVYAGPRIVGGVRIGRMESVWWRSYDLVLLIDSLEHLSPEEGRYFLSHIVDDNEHVIVSVPNGRMDQGETFGNSREAHLWTFNGTEEFEPYNCELIHQSVCTVVSIEGAK